MRKRLFTGSLLAFTTLRMHSALGSASNTMNTRPSASFPRRPARPAICVNLLATPGDAYSEGRK